MSCEDIRKEAFYVGRSAPEPQWEGRGVNGRYGYLSNTAQNRALQADIELAQSLGARDIRVRQLQANAERQVVGANKVDLQFILSDGRRIYVEYDNLRPRSQDRSLDHYWRILSNDPNANIILRRL